MRRLAVVVATLAAVMTTAACGQDDAGVRTPPSTLSGAPEATPSGGGPEATQQPRVSPSPPPPGFADLSDVDPSILQDIRYYTEHNFVGRRVEGYDAPRCLLTTKAAQALRQAQQTANAKGLSLKVYDCYRPVRAGEDFKRWAEMSQAQEMKAEFYPSLSKSDLLSGGYLAGGRSTHSRGSTVDLTLVALPPRAQRPYVKGEPLVACTAPADQRFPDNTVDMGTGFDCFDTRSHTDDPRIQGTARQNRQTLKQLMTGAGFLDYSNEWWHFRLASEPSPDTYFDFPISP